MATVAAIALASSVGAQSFDQNQENNADGGSGRQTATRQRSGNDTAQGGAAASATQVRTGGSDSYTPDQIDTTNARSSGDRATRDGEDTSTRSNQRNGREDAVTPPRRAAQPSEFETFASNIVDKPLRRFGANLLVPDARDFTTPPTATVPPDYRINPGDELVIGLTGSVQGNDLRLTVDSNGRIFVPRVGAITVAGVRYGDIQSVVASQVSRQYRGFRVSVSVGQLRGITVYVTGFAQTPGSYTVSSLSTLVNAVLAAGGPSSGGSFRSIQLRRGGRLISDFDLYDLLLKGDKTADAVLQNGDVIYIAPAGKQVAVIGAVNNEAIFEARARDTLTDVLLYAGGVSTVGDDTRLLVLDPLNVTGGWQQLTPDQARAEPVRRAAVLRVLSGLGIAKPLMQQPVLVTVNGEVARPGRYYVQPGTSLEAAIAQAGGLTGQAYPFGAVLTRDSVRQQQRLSYESALRDAQFQLTVEPLTSVQTAGDQNQIARVQALRSAVDQLQQRKPEGRLVLDTDPNATTLPGALILENNDAIYVPPVPVTVGVFGSVPSPASFGYKANRTVGAYLEQAGGVQKFGDRKQIFVVRANGTLLAPRRGLFKGSILNERVLPGDLVYVPINASRGAFWARLATFSQLLFSGAVAGATVVAVTK